MSTMTNEQAGCEYCAGSKELVFLQSADGKTLIGRVGDDGAMGFFLNSDKVHEDLGYVDVSFCPECGRPFNLRPMTLEEAVVYGRPVWEEHNVRITPNSGPYGWWQLTEDLRGRRVCDGAIRRFWTYQPTPEQSAAWKWEEEEG